MLVNSSYYFIFIDINILMINYNFIGVKEISVTVFQKKII